MNSPAGGIVIVCFDREDPPWIRQPGVLLSPGSPTKIPLGFASWVIVIVFPCEESARICQLGYCYGFCVTMRISH